FGRLTPETLSTGDRTMLDTTRHSTAPFDTALLDRLMDEAGLDVLIATSKHNVQYLLGGHRSFFFDNMDAIGIGRYLPAFVYPKGAAEKAADYARGLAKKDGRIGVELAFIPANSEATLRKTLPDADIKDALFVLERLRVRKTPEELEKLRLAAGLGIDSMLAVIGSHGAGATKAGLTEALRREETSRGL